MRRSAPSFTVEVRRRPGGSAKAGQDLRVSAARIQVAAYESESLRLAAATFGAAKTPQQPSAEGVDSHPKRRILQSLVPESPLADQREAASVSDATPEAGLRAPKPTFANVRKGKDRSSKLALNLEAPCELTAQTAADGFSVAAGRASVATASNGTAVSPDVLTAKSNAVDGNSAGPGPRPKAKRRVRNPIVQASSPAPVAAKDEGSIEQKDAIGALPTTLDGVSRPNRKRTILGRYVVGDELKPGERWKRRLSKER